MKSVILICCLALALQACGGGRPVEPKPEVLGVRLGMSKDEAHKRLTEIGRLEKEERKRQEVWALTNHPTYSHLIVSYNEGYKALRFVTAVAKEGGQRVRYEDVMDVKNAQRSQAEQTVTYTLQAPARVNDNRPAYVVKAIGDPEYVKYYSVEVSE